MRKQVGECYFRRDHTESGEDEDESLYKDLAG